MANTLFRPAFEGRPYRRLESPIKWKSKPDLLLSYQEIPVVVRDAFSYNQLQIFTTMTENHCNIENNLVTTDKLTVLTKITKTVNA